MLIVGHEILAYDDAIRSDQIFDGMRNAVRAQAGSDIGVQDAETANYSAIPIGEQRDSNLILLRKTLESLPGIVADRGDADAFPFDDRTRLLQLDELGTAVLSPIGAAIKNEKQAVGTGEICE